MTDAQVAAAFDELGLGDWLDGLPDGVRDAGRAARRVAVGGGAAAGRRRPRLRRRPRPAGARRGDQRGRPGHRAAADPRPGPAHRRADDAHHRAPALHRRARRRGPGRRRRPGRAARARTTSWSTPRARTPRLHASWRRSSAGEPDAGALPDAVPLGSGRGAIGLPGRASGVAGSGSLRSPRSGRAALDCLQPGRPSASPVPAGPAVPDARRPPGSHPGALPGPRSSRARWRRRRAGAAVLVVAAVALGGQCGRHAAWSGRSTRCSTAPLARCCCGAIDLLDRPDLVAAGGQPPARRRGCSAASSTRRWCTSEASVGTLFLGGAGPRGARWPRLPPVRRGAPRRRRSRPRRAGLAAGSPS